MMLFMLIVYIAVALIVFGIAIECKLSNWRKVMESLLWPILIFVAIGVRIGREK